MDQLQTLSYLETDKFENIAFYQKFGFTVFAEAEVLNVPNWFMSRPPRTAESFVASHYGSRNGKSFTSTRPHDGGDASQPPALSRDRSAK